MTFFPVLIRNSCFSDIALYSSIIAICLDNPNQYHTFVWIFLITTLYPTPFSFPLSPEPPDGGGAVLPERSMEGHHYPNLLQAEQPLPGHSPAPLAPHGLQHGHPLGSATVSYHTHDCAWLSKSWCFPRKGYLHSWHIFKLGEPQNGYLGNVISVLIHG